MKLQDLYDVSQAVNIDTLTKRLVGFANSMDFSIVTAAVVIDPGPDGKVIFRAIGNIPEQFQGISSDADFSRRSPVTKRLKKSSVPFTYNQALYTSEGAGTDWETQAPFGFASGIAVAIHLPYQRHFLLGMDRGETLPQSERKVVRMMADLQLLAVHAQSAALRLLDSDSAKPVLDQHPSSGQSINGQPLSIPIITLTPREREVLKWAMDGKSAWATGKILGLSENTVKFHVKGAMRKLQVGGRLQAVLKAIELRLI